VNLQLPFTKDRQRHSKHSGVVCKLTYSNCENVYSSDSTQPFKQNWRPRKLERHTKQHPENAVNLMKQSSET